MGMISYFKNWITKDLANSINILEARVTDITNENEKLAKINESLTDELDQYKQAEIDEETKRNGSEPWVEIKSANYDDVKGFCIELDWNEAFIHHIREAGIKGNTDDECIQKWMGLLYADIIDDLEQKNVDIRATRSTNEEYI